MLRILKLRGKSESGFTLIEIIAVLVIMGILAAVAIPKFFDLQTKARGKALDTAVAELKVRVNQHFARQLLDGKKKEDISYVASEVGTNLGEEFAVSAWTPNLPDTLSFRVVYHPLEADSVSRLETIELPKME